MNGIQEEFLRIQTFENNDQYKRFQNEVKEIENFKEKVIWEDSENYVGIKFNFHNCLPLNILYEAIANKYLQINNKHIRDILIAILEHYNKLKNQFIQHGNIELKNIIVELGQNQFFDQASKKMDFQIFFTNYTFQYENNDEQSIKQIILKMMKLFQANNSDQEILNENDLLQMKTEVIIVNIQSMNILDEKISYMDKIKQIGQQFKIPFKISLFQNLSKLLKSNIPILKGQLQQSYKKFLREENYNQICSSQDKTKESQIQQEDEPNNTEEVQKMSKSKLVQLQHIKLEQKKFFDKIEAISLQDFVENVILNLFEFNEEQNHKLDLEFIINTRFIDKTATIEILLQNFDQIQTTILNNLTEINNQHQENFKFETDLPLDKLVKAHFDEFLAITQKVLFSTENAFEHKIKQQQVLIKEQLRETYDTWIALKIIELISDLI